MLGVTHRPGSPKPHTLHTEDRHLPASEMTAMPSECPEPLARHLWLRPLLPSHHVTTHANGSDFILRESWRDVEPGDLAT